MSGQRFEQVNGNALDQCKCLRQAVGVESQLDAFLAGKERVAAVHARGLRSVGLQFRFEFGAYKHSACMAALGHVGQQEDFVLHQPVCGGDVALQHESLQTFALPLFDHG